MNDDLVVQKISKLLENNTAFIGYALNGGVGTKINVRNTETGKTIQALSINVDSTGEVLVVKDSADGQYKVVTFRTVEKVSSKIIQSRKTRPMEEIPVKPKPQVENIKILFYVNSTEHTTVAENPGVFELFEQRWNEVWIGGTWPIKKIYTVPSGYRLADVFIVNTGAKEEDYIVIGRLFSAELVHVEAFRFPPTAVSSIPVAIVFTIEKGVVLQQEFSQNSCPPYFWRYCGGGFFYSNGSETGVNTVNDTGSVLGNWRKNYKWFSGWLVTTSNWVAGGDGYNTSRLRGSNSFLNFSLLDVGMAIDNHVSVAEYNGYLVKPGGSYTPLFKHESINTSTPPVTLFGVDTSSSWYYKDKVVNTQTINTFYFFYYGYSNSTPLSSRKLGVLGSFCVTPNKKFNVDYQALNAYSLGTLGTIINPIERASGFIYEPLLVNNMGDKTLVIKQTSTYDYINIENSLLYLSETGESAVFTKISGIPQLNNSNSLGRRIITQEVYGAQIRTLPPTNYSSILDDTAWNSVVLNPPLGDLLTYQIQVYYLAGFSSGYPTYSLSINQSEQNKEILYLRDFLLSFANFVGLTPFSSVNTYTSSRTYSFCNHFKPLSSYIGNSIYIPYGFLDDNKIFYGTQGFCTKEPETTRVLPQSSRAIIKIAELKLDETAGEIKVASNIKNLTIYMVTPEKTGKSTIALASASYWCKEKTKGKSMPIFTPTLSEVFPPPPSPFVN